MFRGSVMPFRDNDDFEIEDERLLRHVLRRCDELERRVRAWAKQVVTLLPKGLPLMDAERELLQLYLAQQRRLNLELDLRDPAANGDGLRQTLGRLLPFLRNGHTGEDGRLAHHLVSCHLEDDIERTVAFFCRDHSLPEMCDPVIDWRVALRYMAQQLHRIACRINLKYDYQVASPLRFELALTARELAAAVVDQRCRLESAFAAVASD